MERLKDQKADQKRLSPGTSFGDRSLQRFRLRRGGPQVWVLCLLPDGWYASRPQPCPGRFFRVMSLRDIPAASLTPDHFRWPPPSSFLVLRTAEPPTYDLVGRASPAEIAALTSRFRHSRPGPSG